MQDEERRTTDEGRPTTDDSYSTTSLAALKNCKPPLAVYLGALRVERIIATSRPRVVAPQGCGVWFCSPRIQPTACAVWRALRQLYAADRAVLPVLMTLAASWGDLA
jgi:hypothetical protein